MKIPDSYSILLFVAFLIILSGLSLILGSMKGCGCNKKEGFDTVPLKIDPTTNKLMSGYYQVDSQNMALIPYGYVINPTDPTKIIPVSNSANLSLGSASDKIPSVPPDGQPLPDGYYKFNDSSLAVLPPNMLPAVSSIDFTKDTPPQLLIHYANGYVSSSIYYSTTFTPLSIPPAVLPAGIYYTSMTKSQVSFLPYGKIADVSNGYGMIDDPKLNSSSYQFTGQYRDISDNYNVQFHDNVQDLQAQRQDASDLSFGQVRVKDQNGNMVILPYVPSQDTVTYYQPGEFPFGSSNYVPNYEDSIYLSTITNQSITSPYATGTKPVEACKAYKDLKAQMERYCS